LLHGFLSGHQLITLCCPVYDGDFGEVNDRKLLEAQVLGELSRFFLSDLRVSSFAHADDLLIFKFIHDAVIGQVKFVAIIKTL